MRIACLDQSAEDRLALQKLLDDSFTNCRNAVGHLATCEVFPMSKEQALINSAPGVFVIGPQFGLEQSYRVCRELNAAYPGVPLILFVEAEHYSLRTLRRFESLTHDIFPSNEAAIRIVHTLSSIASAEENKTSGKLVVVKGVKGGVGTTSIVSGFAHAAEAIGKSLVVVDLSTDGVFSLYMGAQRWSSSDHAAVLIDRLIPDRLLVERCITTAPNGITVLVPPSGGTEVRELWLRDAQTFEISLGIIDYLAKMFDVVLVDLANAEGVYPYALRCRADARVLVTSNDPASVHLLANAIREETESPADGQVHVLINNLLERGLSQEDVLDFLYYQQSVDPTELPYESIAFDPRGRNWIGSGNSFYTESSRAVQKSLEEAFFGLFLSPEEILTRYRQKTSLLNRILPIRRVQKKQGKEVTATRKALPLLRSSETSQSAPDSEEILRPKTPIHANQMAQPAPSTEEPMYESPERQVNT